MGSPFNHVALITAGFTLVVLAASPLPAQTPATGDVFSSSGAKPGPVPPGAGICAKSPMSYTCLYGHPSDDVNPGQPAPPKPVQAPCANDSEIEASAAQQATDFFASFGAVSAPPTTDLVGEETGAPLPTAQQRATAWMQPGVRTQSSCSRAGCYQSAVAQDLRWLSGYPYIGLPRTFKFAGLVNWPFAKPTTQVTQDDMVRTLKYFYEIRTPRTAYALRHPQAVAQLEAGQPIGFSGPVSSQKTQLESAVSMANGAPVVPPRGIVFVHWTGTKSGHAFNVRAIPGSQVSIAGCAVFELEYWDPSVGAPFDWDSNLQHIDQILFYPTN